jgi:hypothetical protein
MADQSTKLKPPRAFSEIRDGMRIDWNVPITANDGLVLRADVFRPIDEKPCPALLTCGPYAKALAFQDGYPSAWNRMAEKHAGRSGLDRPTSIRTGKSSTPRNGCRTATRASASTVEAEIGRYFTTHPAQTEQYRSWISASASSSVAPA